jgi:methionyl-tRNA formyltransferase
LAFLSEKSVTVNHARTLIFGYGELGVTAAETLIDAGAEVVGLVAPSNRTGPDVDLVRSFAAQQGLPVYLQPPRKQSAPFVEQLRALNLDIILVWSYSMILPPDVIDVPRLGCVNVHGGLLPEYRGGHVMQWAIINGETETGVSLHYIDEGVDTGPVIAIKRFPIEWEDDAATVRQGLKAAGQELLKEWWPAIATGTAPREQQDEFRAAYYRLRTPDDGLIDWRASNTDIYHLVRALVRPWPGAHTFLRGRKVVVWRAEPLDALSEGKRIPGVVSNVNLEGIRVATGEGDLMIREIQIDHTLVDLDSAETGISVGDRFGQ